MARYGPADASVSLGGSPVPDVTVIGSLDKMATLEEVTPIGDDAQSHGYVGVYGMNSITLEAPYSTTAGDLAPVGDALGLGGTVAVVITLGGTKTVSFSALVKTIKRPIARGKYTLYQLELQPSGTITEA